MDKPSRVLIVGHGDLLDRSLGAYFQAQGFSNVVSSQATGLDVTRQTVVEDFFARNSVDYVILSSTRSGGIAANLESPGEFIYHNLISESNVIHAACRSKVKKLLFCASSCVYPSHCRQPIKEDALLTGPLESSNEPYSVAKIAGIKMCQAYRQQYGLNAVVMIPATLYGPQTAADVQSSHVLSALIQKFYQAVKDNKPEVVVWGSGEPRREFLFVEDFVSAAVFLMEEYNGPNLINVGCGQDVAIKDLAQIVARVTGFKGKIVFDRSKPDGVSRKLLDSQRMTALGWKPKVGLEEGIRRVCEELGR